MSILPFRPGDEDSLEAAAEMFSPFRRSPELRKMVEDREEAIAAIQAKKPLEFGFIKQNRVRLWAMAYISPRKAMFSKVTKDPYYQGFWVESGTIYNALKSARRDTEELPAVINLYIANMPAERSIAVGSASDREGWILLRCPERENLPKPEPSRLVKMSASAAVGLLLMVLFSVYWPRELFKFSWLLSMAGLGMFIAWRNYGDSWAVGRILNALRPSKRVNIIEEWCPTLEEFTSRREC